jgi:hypothetical protein
MRIQRLTARSALEEANLLLEEIRGKLQGMLDDSNRSRLNALTASPKPPKVSLR